MKHDACMPWAPKYPMGLTQVPKPVALTAFGTLSFHAFVHAGNKPLKSLLLYIYIYIPPLAILSDSMPLLIVIIHTVSIYFDLKVPWDQTPNHKTIQSIEHSATACLLLLSTHAFPPPCLATKINSLHSTADSENIWQLCCQNLFHTAITISQTNVGSSWTSLKRQNKTNPVTLRPRDSVCFLLVSSHFLYPNSKRPIPAQKWTISTANTSQHPKAKQCNNLPMYEPLLSPRQGNSQNDPKTLPGPRPSLLAASTVAPAEISCSTTAAWPFSAAQCSGVQPRAPRMRRKRRGCCGCRRETRCSNGMFLRVVG